MIPYSLIKLLIVISFFPSLDNNDYLVRNKALEQLIAYNNKGDARREVVLIYYSIDNIQIKDSLKETYREYYNIPYIFPPTDRSGNIEVYTKLFRYVSKNVNAIHPDWDKESKIVTDILAIYQQYNSTVKENIWADKYIMSLMINDTFVEILDSGRNRQELINRIAEVEFNFYFNYTKYFQYP